MEDFIKILGTDLSKESKDNAIYSIVKNIDEAVQLDNFYDLNFDIILQIIDSSKVLTLNAASCIIHKTKEKHPDKVYQILKHINCGNIGPNAAVALQALSDCPLIKELLCCISYGDLPIQNSKCDQILDKITSINDKISSFNEEGIEPDWQTMYETEVEKNQNKLDQILQLLTNKMPSSMMEEGSVSFSASSEQKGYEVRFLYCPNGTSFKTSDLGTDHWVEATLERPFVASHYVVGTPGIVDVPMNWKIEIYVNNHWETVDEKEGNMQLSGKKPLNVRFPLKKETLPFKKIRFHNTGPNRKGDDSLVLSYFDALGHYL